MRNRYLFILLLLICFGRIEAKGEVNSEDRTLFALKTNLLGWAALMPNLGVEYGVAEHWSVSVSGSWTHWNWSEGSKHYRYWMVSPEVRYWFAEQMRFKGIYIGGYYQTGQYNFKFQSEKDGRQGRFQGGGVTGGYVLPLNEYLKLDLGIGLGMSYSPNNHQYEWVDGCNVETLREAKNYWGITKANVSLIWVF